MIAVTMGWIGTVGTISAYLLLSRGRWHATSLRYSAINGVGGVVAAARVRLRRVAERGLDLLWS